MTESTKVAKQDGTVAKAEYEKQSGKKDVSSLSAKNLKVLDKKDSSD